MTIITKFQQLTNIICQGRCMMRRVGRGGSRRQKGSARPLGAPFTFHHIARVSKFFRFGEKAVWMDVIAYVVVSVCDQVMMIIITMMAISW